MMQLASSEKMQGINNIDTMEFFGSFCCCGFVFRSWMYERGVFHLWQDQRASWDMIK